jgi:hypothetical protein
MTITDPGRADPEAPRSRSRPTGWRPLVHALLCLAIAAGLTRIEVEVVVAQGSAAWRIPSFVALVLLSVTMLMVGSENAERALQNVHWRHKTLAGRLLYGLTTSLVALAVVVILGGLMLLFVGGLVNPTKPSTGDIVLDFAIVDVMLGAFAGVLATLLIFGMGRLVQTLIEGTDRRFRPDITAARFGRPAPGRAERRDHLLRGAAIGVAGLLASALSTALFAPGQTSSADAHPPDGFHSFLLAAVLPILCWVLGSALAWEWLRRKGFRANRVDARLHMPQHSPAQERPHPRVLHATHAGALAICLMAAGTWWASATINARTIAKLRSGPASPPAAVTGISDGRWSSHSSYLARQFAPKLWLTRTERWNPTSVAYYLANSQVIKTKPFCDQNGCRELNCPDDAYPPAACPIRGDNDPAVYYRYVDTANGVTDPNGPWKLIQYWIFYNYDSLPAGAITQWHQADWEQVSVLVERIGATGSTVQPVEVAFSEHCYGAVLPARLVLWSGSHPISYVGYGSHANYPRRVSVPVRQLRCSLGGTPHYLGVAGLFLSPSVDGTSLELPVDYLVGIRDHAVDVVPSPTPRLIPLDSTPAVSAFDGNWGPDNNLSLLGRGRFRSGAGPQAPLKQSVSNTPMPSMLCSPSWLNPGGHLASWVCPGGQG